MEDIPPRSFVGFEGISTGLLWLEERYYSRAYAAYRCDQPPGWPSSTQYRDRIGPVADNVNNEMARSNSTKRTSGTNDTCCKAKPTAANAISAPTRSKKARLRERLEMPEGAWLDQMMTEFCWQPHTVRAAISGLRKVGLDQLLETGRIAPVYRIMVPGRC